MAKLVTFEGANYSFPDDATDDDVFSFLEKSAKPQTLTNAISVAPKIAMGEAVKGLRAGAQFAADLGLNPIAAAGNAVETLTGYKLPDSGADARLRQTEKMYEQEVRQATEGTPTTLTKGVQSGIVSVLSNAVPMGVGGGVAVQAARGGMEAVPALVKGAESALRIMAGGEGLKEYADQRDYGNSELRSVLHGSITAAAEYFPEKWGSIKIIDAVTGKSPIGAAVIGSMLKDTAGELTTTAIEWLNRKVSREPNLTFADLKEELAVAAIGNTVGAPVQAAAARVGHMATLRAMPKSAFEAPAGTPTGTPTTEAPAATPEFSASTAPESAPAKKAYVNDATLPIIGETPAEPQQLPIEQRIELLRQSYDAMQNRSFQDTAEDRIRKRQDFITRRKEIEDAIVLDPEARQFLNAADAEMGVSVPSEEVRLEQDVYEAATLTPEEIAQRTALRAERVAEESYYGVDVGTLPAGQELGVTQQRDPGMASNMGNAPVSRLGPLVLRSSDAELNGKSTAGILSTLKPGTVLHTGSLEDTGKLNATHFVDQLKTWVDTYLPGASIVLTPVEAGSHLSSAFKLADNVYGIQLPRVGEAHSDMPPPAQAENYVLGRIRSILGMRMTAQFDSAQMDILTHEFTHLLHMHHWESSSPDAKRAIAKEYHEDLQKMAGGASAREALSAFYSPKSAERMVALLQKAGVNVDTTKLTDPAAKEALRYMFKAPNYWFNFSEWMAHKGVKYFTTRLGVRKENVPFFKQWIRKMVTFYKNVVATSMGPTPAFAQWLDSIAARESFGQDFVSKEQIERAKAELAKEGISPDVLNLLQTVRPDMGQVVQDLAHRLDMEKWAQVSESKHYMRLQKFGEAMFEYSGLKPLRLAFASTEFGSRLLQTEQFLNPRTFQIGEFAQRFFDEYLKMGQVEYTKNGLIFSDAFGYSHMLKRNPETGALVASHMESGLADDTITLAMATKFMSKLAEDGVPQVDISQLPLGVQKVLAGRKQAVDPKHFDLPYWAYRQEGQVDLEMRLPALLQNAAAATGIPWLQNAGHQSARMNWLMGKALQTYELINMNIDVPGMREEKAALRNRMMYRHQWLKPANERVEQWAYKIGKTQAAALGRLLFEEAETKVWRSSKQPHPSGVGFEYVLDPAIVSARGLSQDTVQLYSEIRRDFDLFAEEWHKVALWEFSRGNMSDVTQAALHRLLQQPGNVQQAQQIVQMELASMKNAQKFKSLSDIAAEIDKEFTNWRNAPYMPYMRFGRYGVLVKDAGGKTVYFSGHDTIGEAKEMRKELAQQFPGHALTTTYLEDTVYELAGLPPSVLKAMRTKLQLDPQQEEIFSNLLQQLSLANSFKNHAAKKRGIDGYSEDALRAYAAYFRSGSAFMAKAKSTPELADAQLKLKEYIDAQRREIGENNTVELQQLHEWFGRLHTYLSDPGAEYGQLKSALAMFHFAGNLSTAIINTTQVPMVTLPYLAARFGEKAALTETMKAYKDVLTMWTRRGKLSADEEAMRQHGLESGFLDESQATVIGQMADGGALARQTVTGWKARLVTGINYYGMMPFAGAELLNRNVTLLAAYRLNRDPKFKGAFDETAYEAARTTVEDTQNEYAQENRPEISRGAGSVVMQFMSYAMHMAFMMAGGDKSWWRLLLAQLGAAGLLGLPFAEDIGQAAKAIGRKVFGKDVDPEFLALEYLKEMGANADLFVRGISSDIFGFDLSQRIGLGQIVPGMQALGSHRRFDQTLYNAIGDIGGPAVSLVMNGLRLLSQEDPTKWKNISTIMPAVARNLGNASQAFIEGEVKDGRGTKVFEPDLWDIAGMAMGFQPTEMAERGTRNQMQSERAAFWLARSSAVKQMFYDTMDKGQDREGFADFMQRLQKYNEEVPDPTLAITAKDLRSGYKQVLRRRMMSEAGMGTGKSGSLLASRVAEIVDRDE